MVRTVLTTGCSSGIGRATALAFQEAGWTVYATARDRSTLDAVVGRVIGGQGAIDCLVNNAGVVSVSAVEETTPEAFRVLFDVNLFGPHRLARAVVPHMRERRRGRVVNVGSVAGRFPVPLEGAYCASKFGLRALSSSLRDELRPFGVSAVLVEPPYVRTNQARQETYAASGREGSPYAALYARFERSARKEYGAAPGHKAVVRTILRAATVDSPRPRYPVGGRSVSRHRVHHLRRRRPSETGVSCPGGSQHRS